MLERTSIPVVLVGLLFGACSGSDPREPSGAPAETAETDAAAVSDFERELCRMSQEAHVPGLSAAILVEAEVGWMGACGEADLEASVPMSPDSLLNIGSVSKTVTNAAALQLRDRGTLDLDADVSDYLGFEVRHPRFPERPITARQLLTHTSGLADGPSYAGTYACGDPEVPLAEWIEGYLTPGGTWWSDENFLETGPGEIRSYSNVAFGLLGVLVERLSGLSFAEYTRREIFLPLGMDRTAWRIDELEEAEHAVPYLWLEPDDELEVEDRPLLPPGEVPVREFVPYCLYSFYNYPDGLLRTSVRQLVRFVRAHLEGGELDGNRFLEAGTVDEVFSDQLEPGQWEEGRVQGFTWRATPSKKLGLVWGHGGADPGIRAQVLHRPEDEVTVVILANRLIVEELGPILELLFAEGARLSSPRPSR